jgi:hypothetical protein
VGGRDLLQREVESRVGRVAVLREVRPGRARRDLLRVDAAEELRDQANAELASAIEQTDGITVEEYREISQAVRGDPDLAARVTEIYQERAGQ